MAKIRRVVRRVQAGEYHTFDEELWPVNVALVVLAGFVAGAIIAVSRFDDPRWLYNGWFRLTTLVITTGLLIWAASKIHNRRFRRTMQLATVLSLLVHAVLIAVLYSKRLAYLREQELAEADVTVFEQPVTLPEYHEPDPEQPEEHEQPVETEIPEETEAPTDVQRQESEAETPQESRPTPEPGTTPQVEPSPMEKAELTEAAPRRSDEQSKLSRQTAKANPRPDEPVAAPQEQQPAPEQAAQMEAKSQPIERTAETKPEVARPSEQPAEETPIQRQVTQIARRDAAESLPTDSPSAPTLNRALNEPRAVPKVEADAPQPVAVNPSAQPSELLPNSVEIQRQTTAPNVAQQMTSDPKVATAPSPTPLDAARQQPSESPRLATSPEPTQQKAAVEAQLADSQASDAPQANVEAETPGSSPVPSESQVARSEAEAPGASPTKAAGNEPSTAPATISGASLARATPAEAPSIRPLDAPAASPNRAVVTAEAPGSPMNIESPAVAVAEESQSDAAPTRSALSKGSAGIAGVGRDVNFDRGDATTPNPAPVPSASARRAEASQTGPPGPALSPSAPALVAKSVAGANVPQATLAAQDVETANAAGVENPSNMEASSSAAIARADASAPAGKLTAAVGRTDFDVGPTQIVAKVGSGRPSGGGAPKVRLDQQGPQFSRQASGGAPLAAIKTTAAAEVAQAPTADGGGGPVAAMESSVAPATKSSAGGAVAAAGAVGQPVVGGTVAPVTSAAIARAAPGQEAAPGPTATGGTVQPGRATSRVAFAEIQADAAEMAAGPAVGAASPGAGIQAPGDIAVKSAAGVPGRSAAQPVGAVAGDLPAESSVLGGAPGVGLSRRDAPPSNEAAPNVAAVGAPGIQRKTTVAGVATGQIAAVEAPAMEGGPAGGGGEPGGSLQPAQPGVGAMASRSSGALPIQVAALDGPGGLAFEATPNVGSISRQARRDSDIVHAGAARFLSRSIGGPLAIDGIAREPAAAFSRRRGRKLDPSGEYGQPLERTEEAVELGLDFLVRHQAADGSWSLHNYGAGRPGYERESSQLRTDTAATGLALLAFLGAGYDHYDDEYAGQIRSALQFLVKNQKADGDLFIPADAESNKSVWLYSHGIATIALCEAFGMTGDADLREPAQKAIDFIVKAQNKDRGGWRYVPGRDSDTSVSGWQLMALKSGELAGLKVSRDTYLKVEKWLDTSQSTANGQTQYAYNPFAPLQTAPGRFADHGRRPTPATTSMGLLMRLYTGWNRSDPRLKTGCDFLLQNPPLLGTTQQPARDSYYWYYATQLMFHMKGEYWKQWNAKLHPVLVDQQIQSGPFAGSWDPRLPVPDRWGVLGGRMYVTTLNLLSLEVYYRHLPIYEQTAK